MFWLTKAVLPGMQSGSVIINTSSEQAGDPSEDLVDYAMTKAAELNFTKSMAKQLAPKGIRVNAVAPGPFWTPLQVSGGATPEKLQGFGQDSPMGAPGPARRDCRPLRRRGRPSAELFHRSDFRLDGRQRTASLTVWGFRWS